MTAVPSTAAIPAPARPVHRVWELNQLETPPAQLSEAPGPWYLALHRPADQVVLRVLAEDDFRVLSALCDDATLTRLEATVNGSADTLAEILPRLIGPGLVTGFVE